MMNLDLLDRSIFDIANQTAQELEGLVGADVVFYSGRIYPGFFRRFRDFIEEVKQSSDRSDGAIAVVLRTPGGQAETAERMVGVLRKHFERVYFIVPDVAMSAGTILCLSGDKIFMDYASSLGPVDPQVPAPDTKEYVPAMGYLDKVNEITEKERLAPADVVLLRSLDLAKLALFEQAKDLSIDLLKDWLVKYKFKEWSAHRTTNPGAPVSDAEKEVRAEQIARSLADHKMWRSHGRHLDVAKLNALRIEIEDYSDKPELRAAVRRYNDPLTGFIDRMDFPWFMHSHRISM